jgi:hypothetical protein
VSLLILKGIEGLVSSAYQGANESDSEEEIIDINGYIGEVRR